MLKAVDLLWPRSLRLRGWLHQRPPLQQTGPPQAWPACKALVAELRAAPTVAAGQRRWQHLREQSQHTVPEACRCLAAAARRQHLQVPARPRQEVRPANRAARAWEEARRRPKVLPPLWDEARVVKRVFAGLIRVSECWGKTQASECEPQHMRALRQS